MTTPIIEEAFNKLADLFSDYDLHNQPVMKMQTLEALTTIDQNARESRDKEWMEIVTWLTGEKGDFPSCPDGARYCWRTELRKKVETLSHPLNK